MSITAKPKLFIGVLALVCMNACNRNEPPENPGYDGLDEPEAGAAVPEGAPADQAAGDTIAEGTVLGEELAELAEIVEEEYMRDGAVITPVGLAVMEPTEGHDVDGVVTFIDDEDTGQIRVIAELRELSPGKHGFHIHEFGDCSAPDAESAGGHYNPTDMPHGARGDEQSHLGDLGNIIADAEGYAEVDFYDPELTLSGDNSIIGKAVVVHAGEDDLTSQPAGDSGDPVACGVIEFNHPAVGQQPLSRDN